MPTSTYRIEAPAKLNARLKIIDRREDGYHELVSIMVPVDLFDTLVLKVIRRSGIKIESEGFTVPTDEKNLVYRAAESFLSQTGITDGISVKLVKKIPVAAGLGGGSSDAAATLLCLNEINSRPLSDSELQDLAVQLGADVPFFLYCRPALARGIGEILEPLMKWPRFWYVIVTPPLQICTSWAYRNYKLELTTDEYDNILYLLNSDPLSISHILENDLETVTSASFPIIDTLKKLLMDAGAQGAIMSGSGPSVFGVFSSLNQAISAKEHLSSRDLGDVFVTTNWDKSWGVVKR